MSKYKIEITDYSKIDKDTKIVFVVSEFNRNYTKALEDINEKYLIENWFKKIKKCLVPWAFEIPAMIKLILKKSKPDLIIALWAVIRWETTHYEMVAWESARWIMDLSIKYSEETAMINGILTCENEEQVKARISNSYAISWLKLLVERDKI